VGAAGPDRGEHRAALGLRPVEQKLPAVADPAINLEQKIHRSVLAKAVALLSLAMSAYGRVNRLNQLPRRCSTIGWALSSNAMRSDRMAGSITRSLMSASAKR